MNPLQTFAEKYHKQQSLSPAAESIQSIDLNTPNGLTHLLHQPQIDHRWITQTLSDILAIPWLDLDYFEPTKISLHNIPESLVRKYTLLPLWQRQQRLYVAMANPFQPWILEAVQFNTQKFVSMILVEQPKLATLRKTFLSNLALSLQGLPQTNTKTSTTQLTSPRAIETDSINDPPLIRYVNQLLYRAVQDRASDIHFEPQRDNLQIRFRIDGILHPQPAPPSILSERILSRIKIMAQLDIAERRLPQDGRFSFSLPETDTVIDCRISSCPTLQGEKIAIRLLDSQQTTFDIQNLGFNTQQYILLLHALKKSQGMILVTGPTGSGKTLTLYSGLHYLNNTTVNISSAEDPIEIYLPGINQVNIHPKIGLGFAEILKTFLRQDPDIIMIGEMRDPLTAQIAIQAAQTGHLVLSTLHTNSAAETLTRLINMGIPTYNVASSVSLIIAQRLARCLCAHCKEEDTLTPSSLAQRGITIKTSIQTFKAKGCKHCIQGYQGRTGIFELLPISPNIIENILVKKTTATIEKQAQTEGMLPLKEAAFAKVKSGIIDLVEMDRII